MSNTEWPKDLGKPLSSFSVGQTPSPDLSAEIQHVVDETIISVLEGGGQLPAFILQSERIDAIRERLGEQRGWRSWRRRWRSLGDRAAGHGAGTREVLGTMARKWMR